MKPRHLALLPLLVLALSGCAPTTEAPEQQVPEPVEEAPAYVRDATPEDEAAYLAETYDTLPPDYKSDANRQAVLSFGHSLCEIAAESGITTEEAAQDHLDIKVEAGELDPVTAALGLLEGRYAGELLCPEFASVSG